MSKNLPTVSDLTKKIFRELSEIAEVKSLTREYVGEIEAKVFIDSFKDSEIKLAQVAALSESGVGAKEKEYIETFSIASDPFDKQKTMHVFFSTDEKSCSCKIGGSPRFKWGDGGYKSLDLENAEKLLELIAQAKSKMPEFARKEAAAPKEEAAPSATYSQQEAAPPPPSASLEELKRLGKIFDDLQERKLITTESPLTNRLDMRVVGMKGFFDKYVGINDVVAIFSIATSSDKKEIMHIIIDGIIEKTPDQEVKVFAYKVDSSAQFGPGKRGYKIMPKIAYDYVLALVEEKFPEVKDKFPMTPAQAVKDPEAEKKGKDGVSNSLL